MRTPEEKRIDHLEAALEEAENVLREAWDESQKCATFNGTTACRMFTTAERARFALKENA